jgi:hypothetical protein
MQTWKAGIAKAIVTPAKPLWLAGYGGIRQAEGKRHDLWVKALALEAEEGKRALLLTSDLLGLSKPMVDRLCAALQQRFGLERSQVMLTYSHNHCAPVTSETLLDYYPLDAAQWAAVDEYTQWLEDQIIAVIGEALSTLVPATLSAGMGETNFAVNRRNNREAEVSDILAAGMLLNGPTDHSVPVLAVRTQDDRLVAVIFGYACHTTTLNDCLWCGDYAGYAQIAVEQQFPGVTAMFWAGCGGDQNPLPRRSVALCEQYGIMLAEAVTAVLTRPMRPISAQLYTASTTVTLPYERHPTYQELEADTHSDNAIRKRWATRLLETPDADRTFAPSYPYTVQVWRLGDEQLWISLGAEAVVDYALRFKREYGPDTWVVGYAHDMVAYIPSRRVWEEGGYEGGYLYEYGLPAYRWASNVEDLIAAAVAQLAIRGGL